MNEGGGDTPLKRSQNTPQMSFSRSKPSRHVSRSFVEASR
jgi:hypothetical protein